MQSKHIMNMYGADENPIKTPATTSKNSLSLKVSFPAKHHNCGFSFFGVTITFTSSSSRADSMDFPDILSSSIPIIDYSLKVLQTTLFKSLRL